ncbi:hypothetical protein BT67DRAFT_166014 [Trichocladium antarcticum]|uniref:MARVEL domain-containing protein n=1 Tax=Trichocladium antarcticum TaxID=1450529 RepID=A0AAN6UDW7_9PEZI|nr:hypothetical protein BT67DRAFT_166014 [Trichocladium antarcticum]
MILAELCSIILRLAELVFAAIVAGLNGNYLHSVEGVDAWDIKRFIYTEVVAGLSILLAVIWLIPFSSSFIHWPADLILSVCWFVSFGLLVEYLDGSCGYIFNWSDMSFDSTATCAQWKATVAFSFLSAICWLASAILGVYWVRRHREAPVTVHRRRWYRSRY